MSSIGAVGLFLHPSRQGFMPTDAVVRPVVDWAAGAIWPDKIMWGSDFGFGDWKPLPERLDDGL